MPPVPGGDQLLVHRVHRIRTAAPERELDPVPALGPLPVGIEGTDDVLRVPREPQSAGQRDLHVRGGVGPVRDLQAEAAVEGERGGHVRDDEADEVEADVRDETAFCVHAPHVRRRLPGPS
ncbi:hypothetical protein GCM10018791_55640 [Streptomyces zaomyceticus]|nr:hypothetical protein GCM10018791_55640 [Streptomyces zaomyceticus]